MKCCKEPLNVKFCMYASGYLLMLNTSVGCRVRYWTYLYPFRYVSIHCKKSWRSSSTPASGDAGPIHTGVEKSFRHPWRKFYYKYRTFPTFFTSVKLLRQSLNFSKAAPPGLEPAIFTSTIFYSTTAPHLPYVKWVMYIVYIYCLWTICTPGSGKELSVEHLLQIFYPF